MSTESSRSPEIRTAVIVCAALLIVSAGIGVRWWLFRSSELDESLTISVNDVHLVETEGLILDLTPRLQLLNTSVMNLQLPDALGIELFGNSVALSDVMSIAWKKLDEQPDGGHSFIRETDGELTMITPRTSEGLRLWEPLLERVEYFERARFYIVRGNYLSGSSRQFSTDVGFEGLARDKSSRMLHIKAQQEVIWEGKPHEKLDPQTAKIVAWQAQSMHITAVRETLYEESLGEAISHADTLKRLRESLHEQLILENHAALSEQLDREDSAEEANWDPPHPWFSAVSQDRHPSVSVVDIDQDGFDDLYVMPRWGKNLLLRNQGDGTFEDIAPSIGLDIDSHCSSAMFVDIDNDLDPDLILGRTIKPSLLLINDGGRFVDRSVENVECPLPSLVSAVSVADCNSDGLPDIYFSTYAAHMLEDEQEAMPRLDRALGEFLDPDDSMQLLEELSHRQQHRYFNFAGPPNLLLENQGDSRFAPSRHNVDLQCWRHSYQATWSDFDDDGDPDLYVANDFAVNSLFRNDGANGFVDVAEETGTTDIGFGMGAAWGDYDNDGRFDLYVSNMYSKAGRRITGTLQKIDERFSRMARGNSLFRNEDGAFRKVSGLKTPDLQVEKAGWAWSGQFCDIDNDGWLDLHALSGYYSAPKEIAEQVDL